MQTLSWREARQYEPVGKAETLDWEDYSGSQIRKEVNAQMLEVDVPFEGCVSQADTSEFLFNDVNKQAKELSGEVIMKILDHLSRYNLRNAGITLVRSDRQAAERMARVFDTTLKAIDSQFAPRRGADADYVAAPSGPTPIQTIMRSVYPILFQQKITGAWVPTVSDRPGKWRAIIRNYVDFQQKAAHTGDGRFGDGYDNSEMLRKSEKTVYYVNIIKRIRLGEEEIDQALNDESGADPIVDNIRVAMQHVARAREETIFRGYDIRNKNTGSLQPFKTSVLGLMNDTSVQTGAAGGLGGDNVVTDFADIVNTAGKLSAKLRTIYMEPPFILVNSPGVQTQVESNLSTTTGEVELIPMDRVPHALPDGRRVKKYDAILNSEALLNTDETTTTGKMLLTAPRNPMGTINYAAIDAKPVGPVRPFVDQHGMYTTKVVWRGGMAIWRGDATVISPDLTINTV